MVRGINDPEKMMKLFKFSYILFIISLVIMFTMGISGNIDKVIPTWLQILMVSSSIFMSVNMILLYRLIFIRQRQEVRSLIEKIKKRKITYEVKPGGLERVEKYAEKDIEANKEMYGSKDS